MPTYIGRLNANRDMLRSNSQDIIQYAYDRLFELWLEYNINIKFITDLQQIHHEHPNLIQAFTDRLNHLSISEEDKAKLLNQILVLYLPEADSVIKNRELIKEIGSPATVPKIFISYSHVDEIYKNELIVMLAGMQRRKVIDLWQDRRIEAGQLWFDAIRTAIDECNMAILFISPDFLASRFINEEELSRLLHRRISNGLRVLPIIVRPCLWQSEPIIKDLQALPRDGRPIIGFSKENGDREQVWVEIGRVIEKFSTEL